MNRKRENPNIEWDLLVNLCELAITEQLHSANQAIDLLIIDWEKLIQLATKHKVLTLCHIGLLQLAKEKNIPISILGKLKYINLNIVRNNLNQFAKLLRFVQLFREEGIEVIPYKGMILGMEAFGGVGKRQSNDIDFLFHLKDFTAIHAILNKEGLEHKYQIPDFFIPRFIKMGCENTFFFSLHGNRITSIDIHWKIAPRFLQMDITYEDLLDLTILKTYHKTSVRVLSPEGLLLSTCLHHAGKERFQLLKYMCDIRAIIHQFESSLDWTLILNRAKIWKVENLILFGLGMTNHIFKIKFPARVEILIQSKKIQKQISAALLKLNKGGPQLKRTESFMKIIWFHFFIRAHFTTKMKVLYNGLKNIIIPNIEDIKGQNLSKNEYRFLYFTKPYRLLNDYFWKN